MSVQTHNRPDHGSPRELTTTTPRPLACSGLGGFTLLELLMVIMVVSILIGLVLGLSRRSEQVANDAAARAELGDITRALSEFYLANQRYPASETHSITNALPELERWIDADTDGIDPWNTPYVYEYDEEQAPHTYRLFSCGPDRRTGEENEEEADDVYFQSRS